MRGAGAVPWARLFERRHPTMSGICDQTPGSPWPAIFGSAGASPPPPATRRLPPSLPACLPADEAPIIRPGVLSQESRTALKAAYEGAQPFPHSAIHDLCDPQLLRQVPCWRCTAAAGAVPAARAVAAAVFCMCCCSPMASSVRGIALRAGGSCSACVGWRHRLPPPPPHTHTHTCPTSLSSFHILRSLCLHTAHPHPHTLPHTQVREEIINNIEATYKETDLFKMFQTGDLANMDALDRDSAAKLPTVLRLRDALYAPEFRAFISEVTGGWGGCLMGGVVWGWMGRPGLGLQRACCSAD